MHRCIAAIPISADTIPDTKQRMLNWAQARFSIFLFLDSNGYEDPYGRYECLLGAGDAERVISDSGDAFTRIQQLYDTHQDWVFLHLAYDLKNALHPKLASLHPEHYGWPPAQAFVPRVVAYIKREEGVLHIESLQGDPHEIGAEMLASSLETEADLPGVKFQPRFSAAAYIARIAALREHIRNGDCYEINFCNEGFAEGVILHPETVFRRLNTSSPAPFAAFYKDGPRSMMCASPERFLIKSARVVCSQPIKGTAGRGKTPAEDNALKAALRDNEKERAENVMITDLVRSDLAHSCEPGSVQVDELFGIYTYPQVHQMISTISGTLREGIPFTEAIAAAFPMGSMTGAPKHKVMQLIDHYEASRRELFSGSVGYIAPDSDFDLSVVIRSLFYNAASGYLSYQSGGAITWGSVAESEWAELRLKAAAMEALFSLP